MLNLTRSVGGEPRSVPGLEPWTSSKPQPSRGSGHGRVLGGAARRARGGGIKVQLLHAPQVRQLRGRKTDEEASRLLVTARREGGDAVLEFAVAGGEDSPEDRMALLGEEAGAVADDREVSIRLLRHLASSVRHAQYHEIEVVTVRVSGP